VLVVDDNADAADMLRTLLEFSGHTVCTAPDGPSALELVGGFSPEVALLDVGLPGMDGYELARRLRSGPGGQAMTIIAVTGWGNSADRERAHAAGFNAHVTKPADLDTIERLVASSGALV
jgi:CheY-like chemotaxis protein